MANTLEKVENRTRKYPIAAAAGLMIALPGAYLYVTETSLACVAGLCNSTSEAAHSVVSSVTEVLSTHDASCSLDQTFRLPVSKWSDGPAPPLAIRILGGTRNTIFVVLGSVEKMMGLDGRQFAGFIESRWASHPAHSRLASVAVVSTLPGAFLMFIRKHPHSWAARHQTKIAHALHVLALVTVASQKLSIQDMLVTAFVMVSIEAIQRSISPQSSHPKLSVETLLSQSHAIVERSDLASPSPPKRLRLSHKHSASDPESATLPTPSRDTEVDRLRGRLAELKAGEQTREADLKRTRAELQSARATLTETFAGLREELKILKQTQGRDHQAEIYRKEIELFALRKSNEQKEKAIQDRECRLEDLRHQHKTALKMRDAELRKLKERIMVVERQESPRFAEHTRMDSGAEPETQAALQVKFLRVRGRNSTEIIEHTLDEKDREIARLKGELADAHASGNDSDGSLSSIRKMRDQMLEAEQALAEEREMHMRTQDKLREAVLKIQAERRNSVQRTFPGGLTSIPEQNAQELEAMFNTAQKDNSRLHGEVEALEKRVREANARVFTAESTVEALREQLRLEKTINSDVEAARPSVVHHIHFQRLEDQLKSLRDELDAKNALIHDLKTMTAVKDARIDELTKEKSAAQTKLKSETSRLNHEVQQLQATTKNLMLDHERLASRRARSRTSAEHPASIRISGTTLTTDASSVTPSEPITPVSIPISDLTTKDDSLHHPISVTPSIAPRTSSSIQETPERFVRQPAQKPNLISIDAPPAQLRHKRHKSLTIKGFMRKITRKEDESEVPPVTELARPRTALGQKDANASLRPKTAAPMKLPMTKINSRDDVVHNVKSAGTGQTRPKTAAAGSNAGSKDRVNDSQKLHSEPMSKTAFIVPSADEKEDMPTGQKSRRWSTHS